MENLNIYRRQRFGCYSDIFQGLILFLMFIAIQLAMYGLLPVPPAILSLIPQAPMMAGLAPITQGDLLIITVVTAYGAIWGARILGKAVDRLQELSALEKIDPTPSGA